MTLLKPVSLGEVRNCLDRIGSALLSLEREMTGRHFVGDNAEEVQALAERLNNLTRADKGHLPEGMKAWEVKDAA
jgi:hypothetical protein